MEKNEGREYSPSQRGGKKQLIILAQLLQSSMGMKHIDDMLSWLTSVMVKQLDVQLMQVWTMQAFSNGQVSVLLRAHAFEDQSLPQHIFYNTYLAEVVSNLLNGRRGIAPQPVSFYFSSHQATLFERYGINYCFGYFLENDGLLPPPLSLPLGTVAPFAAYVLLFTRFVPSLEVGTAVNQLLAQVVPIARQRGLLVIPSPQERSPITGSFPSQQSPALSLATLIPLQLKDMSAMRTTNPFASGMNLEKKALHLYQAIDGRRTIAELKSFTRYNEKEMFEALQDLVRQRLIALQDVMGNPVDVSRFFNNS